jgi:hypothetical protein
MKMGFMLTAITVLLFMILIETALQYSLSSSEYSKRISEMIVSEKVDYTSDDIAEDVTKIVGLNITQQTSDLVISDSMPASNITTNLGLYENFVRSYYLTPEIGATFLNAKGQPITLNNLSTNVSISPFNLTYGYKDFGKSNTLISIPSSQSTGVQYLWYNISITNGNFSNISRITWNPPPTTCVQGAPNCMRFYLMLNDSSNNQYIESQYNFFDLMQTPGYMNVSFVNQSCYIELQVGNQYLLNLTTHGCNMITQIGFNFNTSNIQLSFPEKLSITDVNYNISKKDNIEVIVTNLLR